MLPHERIVPSATSRLELRTRTVARTISDDRTGAFLVKKGAQRPSSVRCLLFLYDAPYQIKESMSAASLTSSPFGRRMRGCRASPSIRRFAVCCPLFTCIVSHEFLSRGAAVRTADGHPAADLLCIRLQRSLSSHSRRPSFTCLSSARPASPSPPTLADPCLRRGRSHQKVRAPFCFPPARPRTLHPQLRISDFSRRLHRPP